MTKGRLADGELLQLSGWIRAQGGGNFKGQPAFKRPVATTAQAAAVEHAYMHIIAEATISWVLSEIKPGWAQEIHRRLDHSVRDGGESCLNITGLDMFFNSMEEATVFLTLTMTYILELLMFFLQPEANRMLERFCDDREKINTIAMGHVAAQASALSFANAACCSWCLTLTRLRYHLWRPAQDPRAFWLDFVTAALPMLMLWQPRMSRRMTTRVAQPTKWNLRPF